MAKRSQSAAAGRRATAAAGVTLAGQQRRDVAATAGEAVAGPASLDPKRAESRMINVVDLMEALRLRLTDDFGPDLSPDLRQTLQSGQDETLYARALDSLLIRLEQQSVAQLATIDSVLSSLRVSRLTG